MASRPDYSLWLNDGTLIGHTERFTTLDQVGRYVAKMRPRLHPKPGGDVVVVRQGRTFIAQFPVPAGAPARRNPAVFVAGNPAGRLLSRNVKEIRYIHAKRRGAYYHKFGAGVCMEALPDGSCRIYHPTRPVWVEVED